MIIKIILLLLGFILLIKGANYFIDGTSSLAMNLKISKRLVGLTIVAFGTSIPELAISFKAILSNNHEILLSNIIGSNITNVLLLLGIGGLLSSIRLKSATVKKELALLLLITLLLPTLLLDINFNNAFLNEITRSDGIVLLLFFLVFIYYIISIIRKNAIEEDETPKYSIFKSIIISVIGLVGIIYGSNLTVDNALAVANTLGLSKRIITLAIISPGTSLPELITTIIASLKKEQDIMVGNIIGTNIFNICIVLGLPVAILGNIVPQFSSIDIFMLLFSSIILYIISLNDYKITKLESIVMLLIYIFYYIFILL